LLRLDAEIDCVAGRKFARVGVVRLIGDDFSGSDCDDVADELAEEFTRGDRALEPGEAAAEYRSRLGPVKQ
jgi:hypothetical protein